MTRSWFIFRRGRRETVIEHRLLAQHLADTTPPARGGNPIQAAFLLVVLVVGLGLGIAVLVRGCGEGAAKHRRLNPVTAHATKPGR